MGKTKKNLDGKEQIYQFLGSLEEKKKGQRKPDASRCRCGQLCATAVLVEASIPRNMHTNAPLLCAMAVSKEWANKNQFVEQNKQNFGFCSGELEHCSYRSGFNKCQELIHESIIILFHLEPFVLDCIQNYCKPLCEINFLSRQEKKRPFHLIVLLCFN